MFKNDIDKKNIITLLVLIVLLTGCKKFIDVEAPVTSINNDNVYASDATASAVIVGIFSKLSRAGMSQANELPTFSFFGGLSSDEFTLSSQSSNPQYQDYYNNQLNVALGFGTEFWISCYQHIFTCNAAIEGLRASHSLTPVVKQQLLGEAHFLRAFFYFYLVNLYGKVPLVTTTDYKTNAVLPRADTVQVYSSIVSDLQQAQQLLAEQYVGGDAFSLSGERTRPCRWAATALLARVYLYNKQYNSAIEEADKVIGETDLFDIVNVPLADAFLANNHEAIWQLQPVNAGWNTEEARLFVLPESGPGEMFPVYLNNTLVADFEAGDMRLTEWVGSLNYAGDIIYYPFKYKRAVQNDPVAEYSTVLRLAEQYLIRAEAKLEIGETGDALNDLNIIRRRAGLDDYLDNSVDAIRSTIYHERQIEFFSEWGHRWLDLKRRGLSSAVLSAIKGSSWQDTDILYPIPQSELDQNPNMKGQQNEGY